MLNSPFDGLGCILKLFGVNVWVFNVLQQSHTTSGSPQLTPDGLKLVNPLFS